MATIGSQGVYGSLAAVEATVDLESAGFDASAWEFLDKSSDHPEYTISGTVPAGSPYQVRMPVPLDQADLSVTVATASRVVVGGTAPASGQVAFDKTDFGGSGVVTFHSSDAGLAFVVTMTPWGSAVPADWCHAVGAYLEAVTGEVKKGLDLGTGLVVKTGDDPATWAARTLAETGSGITITNGDGVAGNPTLSLEAGLEAIAGLAKTDGGVIVGDGTTFVLETGATARASLGLAIGTNVQAWNAYLDQIAALDPVDGTIIVGGTDIWVAESGDTARTSLGLGSANAVSFASVTATGLVTGSNLPSKATGNAIVGPGAGPSGTLGDNNVIVGNEANQNGSANSQYNVIIGWRAGKNYGADANAQQAVFIGREAGTNATTGIASVCIGESAGFAMTTGMDNVLVGSDAGWNAADTAGAGITTGSHNSAFGNNAGYTAADASQTGSHNSAFGANSGWTGGSAAYQTAIGAGAIADADNQVMLGRATDEVAIPGDLDLRGEVTSDLTMAAGAQIFADNTALVGEPAYAFAGDPDTGMYSAGANTIGWSCGGTQRMALAGSRLTLANIDIGSSTFDNLRPSALYLKATTGAVYSGDKKVLGAQQAAISNPSGQANDLDTEARAAIDSILTALRTHGLIAT